MRETLDKTKNWFCYLKATSTARLTCRVYIISVIFNHYTKIEFKMENFEVEGFAKRITKIIFNSYLEVYLSIWFLMMNVNIFEYINGNSLYFNWSSF